MKKFGIFLLGIIVAVIGFYFLSNKTEPLPDNPPSNIEQPGDENEQPGGDNETPTPDNPGDVGSEIQYTTNTFSIDNIASFQLFKFAEDNVTLNSVDTTNGLDQTQLEVGAIYNLHLDVAYGYEIVEVVYNSNCLLSAPIESSVQVTFTAVENGVFSVTTQIIEPESPVNTFSLENIETIAIYESIDFVYDKLDTSAGLDNIELKPGTFYRVLLMPKNGFTISSVIYNGETQYRYSDASSSIYAVGFQAVDNATFEVVTEASSFTIGTTTNDFTCYDSYIENLFKVEADGSLTLVDFPNGLINAELTVGQEYCLEVVADEGYTVSSFSYGGVSYTFEKIFSTIAYCNFIADNHNGNIIVRCSPVE